MPSLTPAAATAVVLARRIGIVLTFVLVLIRPGVGEAEVSTQLADIDVLVVVDRTRSMAALDGEDRQPRIDTAKADLAELVTELPGARFGMLTFGAEARLTLPFTTDVNAFSAAVETLYLEGPKDGSGSRADRPVPELVEVLERVAEQRHERRRVVIYVGDGEDTATEDAADGGTDHSFADAADLIAGGMVLGYGTEQGAPMPASPELDDEDGFVTDPESDQSAISKADLDNLRQIADELGVGFEHRTTGGSGMSGLVADLEPSYADGDTATAPGAEHDLTWLFGLILLALVLFELRAGWLAMWRSPQVLLGRGGRP